MTTTHEMALIAEDGYVLEPEYLRACLGAYHDAREDRRHGDVARLCGTFVDFAHRYGIETTRDDNGVRNSVDQIASALFERMTTFGLSHAVDCDCHADDTSCQG